MASLSSSFDPGDNPAVGHCCQVRVRVRVKVRVRGRGRGRVRGTLLSGFHRYIWREGCKNNVTKSQGDPL